MTDLERAVCEHARKAWADSRAPNGERFDEAVLAGIAEWRRLRAKDGWQEVKVKRVERVPFEILGDGDD